LRFLIKQLTVFLVLLVLIQDRAMAPIELKLMTKDRNPSSFFPNFAYA